MYWCSFLKFLAFSLQVMTIWSSKEDIFTSMQLSIWSWRGYQMLRWCRILNRTIVGLPTRRTRPASLMPFHVKSQMVGSGKTTSAIVALEWFGSRVFPIMPGELIRTGKAPFASIPWTPIRLLSCKHKNILNILITIMNRILIKVTYNCLKIC